MCFYIHGAYPTAQISKKDIRVAKELYTKMSGTIYSPYQHEIYWTEIINEFLRRVSIPNGPAIKTATFYIDTQNKFCRTIHEGLHSYSTKVCIFGGSYIAIIPKGTPYYYNPDDMEYVSEKLIVFKTKKSYNIYKFKKLFNLK